MTREEINQAQEMIAYGCDRVEICGDDSEGGLCLTAHWVDGGQKLFHTLAQVESHCRDMESRAFAYACGNQGFTGDYAAWKALSAQERAEYEAGAAGIPTA